MALGAIGVGLSLGGAVGSLFSGRSARRAQRRQQAVQRRMNESQIRRERQMMLRQAQQARAGAESMAALTGMQDSSGAMGQRSAIGAATAGNLAYSLDVEAGGGLAQHFASRAAHHQGRAQTFAAVSQLGGVMTSLASMPAGGSAPQGVGAAGGAQAGVAAGSQPATTGVGMGFGAGQGVNTGNFWGG